LEGDPFSGGNTSEAVTRGLGSSKLLFIRGMPTMERDDLAHSNKKEDVKRDEKEKVVDKKNGYFVKEFEQYFFHLLDCE
jgi:hypothetical protein